MRRQGERPELIHWRLSGTNRTWSFVPQRGMKTFRARVRESRQAPALDAGLLWRILAAREYGRMLPTHNDGRLAGQLTSLASSVRTEVCSPESSHDRLTKETTQLGSLGWDRGCGRSAWRVRSAESTKRGIRYLRRGAAKLQQLGSRPSMPAAGHETVPRRPTRAAPRRSRGHFRPDRLSGARHWRAFALRDRATPRQPSRRFRSSSTVTARIITAPMMACWR
jgi:hypothetical protein